MTGDFENSRSQARRMPLICDKAMRLDAFIASNFIRYSRNRIKEAVRNVRVNGKPVGKLSKLLSAGDSVEFELDDRMLEKSSPECHSEPVDLDMVYEDDWLAVINKPQGVAVHHGNGHFSGTVEDALFCELNKDRIDEMSAFRYGIVHRLDMDTSGLMVIAKTSLAAEHLIGEFKGRRVFKEYIALAEGHIAESEGTIVTGIRRSERNRLKFETCEQDEGKIAITEYNVLKYYADKATLLSLILKTGRTHQIRVHLKSIGNPIMGDVLYGKPRNCGMTLMLHAKRLGFHHPSGEYMEFDSDVPERFSNADRMLGG
ncbi:MAG TPA: RluA family pseudouridine synthase [Spirochaetaceae bacterium]|nr:RluA family pseudouridine synthase [Spirochaetaceae bacterium]